MSFENNLRYIGTIKLTIAAKDFSFNGYFNFTYLHDGGDADGRQVKRVNRFKLHPGDEVSGRWSVLREHVGGAVRR